MDEPSKSHMRSWPISVTFLLTVYLQDQPSHDPVQKGRQTVVFERSPLSPSTQTSVVDEELDKGYER